MLSLIICFYLFITPLYCLNYADTNKETNNLNIQENFMSASVFAYNFPSLEPKPCFSVPEVASIIDESGNDHFFDANNQFFFEVATENMTLGEKENIIGAGNIKVDNKITKNYDRKNTINTHLQQKMKQSFQCLFCAISFSSNRILDKHVSEKHNIHFNKANQKLDVPKKIDSSVLSRDAKFKQLVITKTKESKANNSIFNSNSISNLKILNRKRRIENKFGLRTDDSNKSMKNILKIKMIPFKFHDLIISSEIAIANEDWKGNIDWNEHIYKQIDSFVSEIYKKLPDFENSFSIENVKEYIRDCFVNGNNTFQLTSFNKVIILKFKKYILKLKTEALAKSEAKKGIKCFQGLRPVFASVPFFCGQIEETFPFIIDYVIQNINKVKDLQIQSNLLRNNWFLLSNFCGITLYEELLKHQYSKNSIKQFCNYMADVIVGLHGLHLNGFAHNGIEPHNILVNEGSAKIIDFSNASRYNRIPLHDYSNAHPRLIEITNCTKCKSMKTTRTALKSQNYFFDPKTEHFDTFCPAHSEFDLRLHDYFSVGLMLFDYIYYEPELGIDDRLDAISMNNPMLGNLIKMLLDAFTSNNKEFLNLTYLKENVIEILKDQKSTFFIGI